MIPIVLYYHQVLRQPRPEHYFLQQALKLDQFRTAMIEVKERWHPLRIDEFVWIFRNGRQWPKRSVLITFDDGFKNNLWAAEVLQELGMSALFFVVSGVVGTKFQPWYLRFAELMSNRKRDVWTCSWGATDFRVDSSRRRWLKLTKEHLLALRPGLRDVALQEIASAVGSDCQDRNDPDLEFFSVDDLRQIQQMGMALGAHSRTHDNLTACSAEELRSELVDSADELSQMAATPIRYFSYPDGRFDARTLRLVRDRFDAAFTTENRYTAPDLWRYPRRAGDGCGNVSQVLSPWFPAKRKLINSAKRILKY
jgi:peptidoglycan/xylan/chitin deacetylase (PgdA/CDA1 family)